jgi:hypothetical protein
MSSPSPPEAPILTALQELLEAWSEEDFATAAQKCLFLLKKKKALDSSLTSSAQRLLLQAYLQNKEYAKVVEWVQTSNNSNSNSNAQQQQQQQQHKDLALYANYRLESYDAVSKQASKDSPLEQHLLAQSHFHLNQVNPALKMYQELLLLLPNKEQDDAEAEAETKMELLTNALAVLSSSNVIPYVKLTDNYSSIISDQAAAFLEDHPEYYDLALNLGTLEALTEPSSGETTRTTTNNNTTTTNWLQHAKDHCDDPDDLVPIQTNLAWSKHFWYQDLEDVHYDVNAGTAAQMAIAKLNQSLLVLDQKSKSLPSQPHAKWNSLQVRMYWYNRAVQQFRSGKLIECQESCQSLKKTTSSSSSANTNKGSKKKNVDSSSPAEWWWNSRVDVVLAHVQQEQGKTQQAITKLEQRLEGLKHQQPSSPTIDHATAYVQLHLHSLQHSSSSPTKDQTQALLKSLPASIQSRPAVVATLEVLGAAGVGGSNNNNKNNNKSKTKGTSPTDEADALLAQGQYEQAATLYEQHLPAPSKCNDEQLAQQLRRVQALTMSEQHEQATRLWESVQPRLEDSTEPTAMDGEALENQALPRSSTTTTQFATTAAAAADETPKRSHEAVMRRRARQREAYLQALEAKGGYNPDRPSKPNPERWIPKHERSRARRRGQHGRSAQGGASQADAQRLDAAARRAGTVPASSAGPSTAGLKVVSATGGARKGGRRR